MNVRATALSLFSVSTLLAVPLLHAKQLTVLDLTAFSGAQSPSIVIQIVTNSTSFNVRQTPALFDDLVSTSGPDYRLQIVNRELCMTLMRELAGGGLAKMDQTPESVDVRYRLDLLDGDRLLKSIHIGRFGQIVDSGRVLRFTDNDAWVARLWLRLGTIFTRIGQDG